MNGLIEERQVRMKVANWVVDSNYVPQIAVQNDNETCRLIFVGDVSRDLRWDLLLRNEDQALNIISLEPMEEGVGVLLTREMVCVAGSYGAQLRGSLGTQVRHTNQFVLRVLESFSGDQSWPTLPSEFTQLEQKVREAADQVSLSETNALESEKRAETNSGKAQQALTDMLAMMGTDVATLVGGKLPMSQIPATATQEIYTVARESELIGLTAQRGDLAELIEVIDGERTITRTWQCLGDAGVRENWVVWGTSYAVQAGYAAAAKLAENASTINSHRIVEMTEAQYQQAVKDPETYYLVYAPEVNP